MTVYLIETGQLSNLDNKYHFYDKEIFSSQKAVDFYLNNSLECNKATNVEIEEDKYCFHRGEKKRTMVSYECMSVDEEPKLMKVRVIISKFEVTTYR